MTPEILILAAGSSSRMRGGDKLLEFIDNEPQLTRITRAAQEDLRLAPGQAVVALLKSVALDRQALARDDE